MSLKVTREFQESLSRSQLLGLPFTRVYARSATQKNPDVYLIACFEKRGNCFKPTQFTNKIPTKYTYKVPSECLGSETTYVSSINTKISYTPLEILERTTFNDLDATHAAQLCGQLQGPCETCSQRVHALVMLKQFLKEFSSVSEEKKDSFTLLIDGCLRNQMQKWPPSRPASRAASTVFSEDENSHSKKNRPYSAPSSPVQFSDSDN